MPSQDDSSGPQSSQGAKETPPASPRESPPAKSIRYRRDYRDFLTNALVDNYVTDDPQFDNVSLDKGPAFDVVMSYRVRLHDQKKGEEEKYRVAAHIEPLRHIEIHSTAIINALQSVVQYYPQQNLSGDSVDVIWPYPVIVHHYDELAKFREDCLSKDPSELCVREKLAAEHLRLLLDFVDKEVMTEVNAEKERNKRGYTTYDWTWVMHKPGTMLMETTDATVRWSAFVIHSINGGSFTNPKSPWLVEQWGMCFDGRFVGRFSASTRQNKWDGENYFWKNTRYIDKDRDLEDPDVAYLIKSGEMYWKLLRKGCRYYNGPTKTFPYNHIDGLVMADVATYYAHFQSSSYSPGPGLPPQKRPPIDAPVYNSTVVHSSTSPPEQMGNGDLRNWTSDCTCTVCKQRTEATSVKRKALFADYNGITLEKWDELKPEQYLLCPLDIPAFVFRTRTWEHVEVAKLVEPTFKQNMMDNLVMDPKRAQTLKSLAKSYARVNKHGEEMKREPWAADFVKGKGNGLIFLLHGSPGVGKTCTAECIAEYTSRPLMVLTSSDIGTFPTEVEYNLTKYFKTAKSWGAVLLIDEADVFMEHRSTTDLNRNGLVAGLLRALEFYDGILFLTTNRVGTFDDAFISRIHVQMYYPAFTNEERKRVWKTFTKKLADERGDYIRLNMDAKEYLDGKQVRELEWNGREIRNAFQTAVSLAEYDAQKDEEGKILLTDEHLKAVVELSKDFKDYLDELHRGDEGKRAERTYTRLDSYHKRK